MASSIARKRAGLSRPCGMEGGSGGAGAPEESGGAEAGGGSCRDWDNWADVPGTAMLLKSILGRPVCDGGRRQEWISLRPEALALWKRQGDPCRGILDRGTPVHAGLEMGRLGKPPFCWRSRIWEI